MTRRRLPAERIRLDKWLWAARFYKTRTLAAQAIDAGQVRVGGARVKPAHPMRVGERVNVRKGGSIWDVDGPLDLSDRAARPRKQRSSIAKAGKRRGAREAALERKAANASTPRFPGRPTKRNRRKLDDFSTKASLHDVAVEWRQRLARRIDRRIPQDRSPQFSSRG